MNSDSLVEVLYESDGEIDYGVQTLLRDVVTDKPQALSIVSHANSASAQSIQTNHVVSTERVIAPNPDNDVNDDDTMAFDDSLEEEVLDPTVPRSPVFDAQESSDSRSSSDDDEALPTSNAVLSTHRREEISAARAPRKVEAAVVNEVWQQFEAFKQQSTPPRVAAAAAPRASNARQQQQQQPPLGVRFSPQREVEDVPKARPMSLFRQRALLDRGAELAANDDSNLDELAARNPLLERALEIERSDAAHFQFDRLAHLRRPMSANVPRGEFAPSAELQRIMFDTLTEDEVRRISTRLVKTTSHFEHMPNGELQPLDDGLLSSYMGPIERNRTCAVCQGTQDAPDYLTPSAERYMCDGHFGRIELAGALYHPEMADTLVSALRCFCWECGSLPGDDRHNRAVIRQLVTPNQHGKHKSRAERLAILSAHYGKRLTCEQCFKTPEQRLAARCNKCPTSLAADENEDPANPADDGGVQCIRCARPTQYRAQIRKLHKQPFDSFPYLIFFDLPKRTGVAGLIRRSGVIGVSATTTDGTVLGGVESKEERDQALLDNYCDRLDIKYREMELSPERARKIIDRIGNDAALLLSVEIWHDASTGEIARERFTQAQLRDAKRSAVEWLESMAPRVLLVSGQDTRRSDVSAGLAKTRLNELTSGYADIMRADDRLRETQLPSSMTRGVARANGIGNGIMRFREDESWCSHSHSDMEVGQVAELYGRVQYYWAIMIRATHAPFWLPTGNRSIKVPDKAQKGAERTKNKGRGFLSDLGGKEGLLRKSLQGSHTNFSFRSVIVPDPRIGVDEIAISREFAERLSTPVQLAAFNIESVLRQAEALRVGAHRGARLFAKLLIFNDDRTQAISYTELVRSTIYECSLARIGSWVELPLREGSVVVMNRQPSLHKPSMMAHRVHILPDDNYGLTTKHDDRRLTDAEYAASTPADPPFRRSTRTGPAIRLNGNVVGPYNADFDGDEVC